MVSSQKINILKRLKRELIDSAKPGHSEPSDRSAAKKTDNGYQGTWHVEFCID